MRSHIVGLEAADSHNSNVEALREGQSAATVHVFTVHASALTVVAPTAAAVGTQGTWGRGLSILAARPGQRKNISLGAATYGARSSVFARRFNVPSGNSKSQGNRALSFTVSCIRSRPSQSQKKEQSLWQKKEKQAAVRTTSQNHGPPVETTTCFRAQKRRSE